MIISKIFLFFPFILFTIFNQIKSITDPFMFKCLKDELKIKKICAIEGQAMEENEDTSISTLTNYLYIKKKCGKKELCKQMDDSILYQCFPKLKKLKIGDKCSVNEECYTGFCSMSICQGIDYEGDCTDYPNGCKPGMYCTHNDKVNKDICVEYATTNKLCGYSADLGHEIQCYPGLICQIRDNGSGTTVCKKWGTFDLNKEVTDERLCKSGMALIDTEVDSKLKCVAVEEDGECDESTHKCNPLVVGIGANPDVSNELTLNCVGGITNMYACPLSIAKTKLFENYIEEYNKKFDFEKNEKSQFYKEGYFNDVKLTELYIKYKQYEYLKAYELIDFEGNDNGEYECEYNFIWTSYLSFNLIKLNIKKMFLFIFMII